MDATSTPEDKRGPDTNATAERLSGNETNESSEHDDDDNVDDDDDDDDVDDDDDDDDGAAEPAVNSPLHAGQEARKPQQNNTKRKITSNSDRMAVVDFLKQHHKNGRLNRGAIGEAIKLFPCKRTTVRRIWQRALPGILDPNIPIDVSLKRKNCGRKKKYGPIEELLPMINDPLQEVASLRRLSAATSIPKTSLWRLLKASERYQQRFTTGPPKPNLTDANKQIRMEFCKSFVRTSGDFDTMLNHVHIDIKWFYINKSNDTDYLLPDGRVPKSKKSISKVMILAAVARPRYDYHRKHQFDGKIGIWPFIYQEAATAASKQVGRNQTRNFASVTKDNAQQIVMDKVIPAIHSKWPLAGKDDTIIIQHDNAISHCSAHDDRMFMGTLHRDGWNITFQCQPPNSPDLNVVDSGLFDSIQSLQQKENPESIDDLVAAVVGSFNELQTEALDDLFLRLQLAMQETMRCQGGNDYELQENSNEEKLRQDGRLKSSLLCDPTVLEGPDNMNVNDFLI